MVDDELSLHLQWFELSGAAEPLAKFGVKTVAEFKILTRGRVDTLVAEFGLPESMGTEIMAHLSQLDALKREKAAEEEEAKRQQEERKRE
eukprot:CAMPEP_0181299396 /NCGR_PEP_ID=MMETSP1101-20121128/6321_1 /TAXON_ID=46948 /ORGANISM="Rhodomonas abbreviata, Strain Caron Lab Isolate" /LENGTH=89 /DNA_ID=CAMNT_0023404537 /DNA_START=64 /DNA_END=330 /DNA_ORIENTATION=+